MVRSLIFKITGRFTKGVAGAGARVVGCGRWEKGGGGVVRTSEGGGVAASCSSMHTGEGVLATGEGERGGSGAGVSASSGSLALDV